MGGVASKYETLDSGKREEYASGMHRDTEVGKPRYDLIDPVMLKRWAELMSRGAKKYGENNWRKADSYEELDRFISSAMRHLMQWRDGETGEDHAAAVLFNIAAAEYVKGIIADNSAFIAFSGDKATINPKLLVVRDRDGDLISDIPGRAGRMIAHPGACVSWTDARTGMFHKFDIYSALSNLIVDSVCNCGNDFHGDRGHENVGKTYSLETNGTTLSGQAQ